MKRFLRPLRTRDITTVVFLTILSLLTAVFHARIDEAATLIAINSAASLAIVFFCRLAENKTGLLRIVRDFYMVPGILLVFKEMYILVPSIHPADYDVLLAGIDRWMFGTDPTRWIFRFAHPVVTEILQIAYSLFYFSLVIIGIDLYARADRRAFDHGLFAIVYGFFLSYLGYLCVPAIGPRFILHDFARLPEELPGLFLTSPLRYMIDIGESIPEGTLNPAAIVQRDAFPSGHAMMTLVIMYLAWKFRARTRWFLWITGTLLIVGTVYLRYHYVIDLIAGLLFMLFTVWSAPILERKWYGWTGRKNGNGTIEVTEKWNGG